MNTTTKEREELSMMSSDNVEWTKRAGYESRWGGKSNMNLIHDEEEEGHVSVRMKEITRGAEWKKAGFPPFPSCTKNPGIWILFLLQSWKFGTKGILY